MKESKDDGERIADAAHEIGVALSHSIGPLRGQLKAKYQLDDHLLDIAICQAFKMQTASFVVMIGELPKGASHEIAEKLEAVTRASLGVA